MQRYGNCFTLVIMKLSFRQIYKTALPVGLALAGALASGCLQRPVGTDQPKTTNVIVDALKQNSVDKIDLLFMIDNSLSMGDKQELLADALPDLVRRLVDPVCVSEGGGPAQMATGGNCPQGTAREFQPIHNIHIGVITSSLGGFGSELDCISAEEGETDNSYLLGSLDRVRAVLPETPEFLRWCRPDSDPAQQGVCSVTPETSNGDALAFSEVFADQVRAADEFGCGWEASLEAWYRFLIEPYPWTKVVRQNCPFGGDMNALCVGPEKDASGVPYIDDTIIDQRKRFLRPDSLLAIVMLTDENDCSFKASGQSWRLSQTFRSDGSGGRAPSRAYKGSTACATDPNDPCCVSCGTGPAAGCATEMNADGDTVNLGCAEPLYKSADDLAQEGSDAPSDDAVNLRCFDHKRRFGVDYLYPVERYSNALLDANICPFADTLKSDATATDGSFICGANQEFVVDNPLFEDLTFEDRRAVDMTVERALPRSTDLIFLAGIVGVPWQDLAMDPAANTLVYKTNNPNNPNGDPTVDWVQLLGAAEPHAPYDLMRTPPTDPLMHEQIEARSGTNAAINGGEWNILDRDDLQYACTFELNQPVECPAQADLMMGETVACDCTYYGGDEFNNPLCNGLTQTHAKAYPSIRPLQVLRDYGPNSIVASICPKNTTDDGAPDYGYRPAVAAIIDRLKEQLQDKCFPRTLEVKDLGEGRQANCIIVEADPDGNATCGNARAEVPPEIQDKIYERLLRQQNCDNDQDCRRYHLCSITPITPNSSDYDSCLTSDNPTGHGWCYIDPAQGLGTDEQVEKCADHEKRKIRFAGDGAPQKGTVTFFACAGAPQGAAMTEEADMSTDMPAEDM